MPPTLTIGLATYQDFDGVYFTVQALRMYNRQELDGCKILVVDNAPDSPESKSVKEFLGWVRDVPCTYAPFPHPKGTSAPRAHLFQRADTDVVLCMDSHVLLRPGALTAVRRYFHEHPDSKDLLQGPLLYDDLRNLSTHFRDEWRAEMWGVWDYDPRGDRNRPECSGEPFDVPAQGLGVFAMLKKSFPGWDPRLRGFGGEEFCFHELVRQKGGRTLCHPDVLWLHRFGRPQGVPYPLTNYHKARNYYLWFERLGRHTGVIKDHFVATGKLTESDWDAIVAGKESPTEKSSCNACSGKFPTPPSLDDWFKMASATPSDINEHAATLRELASRCDTVVEFGHRPGVSSVALLAGVRKKLVSCAPSRPPEVNALEELGKGKFEFLVQDSLAATLPCDLLFLDTVHTADRLYQELLLHHASVSRYVVLHDTAVFGERGEDGGPGLLPALRRFLKEFPHWSVVTHHDHNNGLTVLSCNAEDKPKLPSTWQMAGNFLSAVKDYVASGLEQSSPEVLEERLMTCSVCELRTDDRCSSCGCYLAEKAKMKSSECPIGRWKV